MSTVLYVCGGALIVAIVVVIILYLSSSRSIKLKQRKEIEGLKKLSLTELERKVYRYDTEYFKFIGEENESVLEFKKIIENKDVLTLYKKWESSFIGSFIALERKSGNNGRPMLMDHYFWYELEVKELYERKKADLQS